MAQATIDVHARLASILVPTRVRLVAPEAKESVDTGAQHDNGGGDGIVTVKLPLAVLDGGFATHLEDQLGADLSSRLWSASLLLDAAGREKVLATHLAFLRAGADVVETASYQASFETLQLALQGEAQEGHGGGREGENGGLDAHVGSSHRLREDAIALMQGAVKIAVEARKRFLAEQPQQQLLLERDASRKPCMRPRRRPLVALSLGPRGTLNGAEYTGDYRTPDEPRQPGEAELLTFHRERLRAFLLDGREGGSRRADDDVELVLIETLPRLDEARAAIEAWRQVRRELIRERRRGARAENSARSGEDNIVPPALVLSFVFPHGERLPWPPHAHPQQGQQQEASTSLDAAGDAQDETSPEAIARLLYRHSSPGVRAEEGREAKAHCATSSRLLEEEAAGNENDDEGYPTSPLLQGVGINCTKPYYLEGLATRLSLALRVEAAKDGARRWSENHAKPLLFLYPDGGMVWDGVARAWRKPDAPRSHNVVGAGGVDAKTVDWAEALLQVGARAWQAGRWSAPRPAPEHIGDGARGEKRDEGEAAAEEDGNVWGGVVLGGCCKSTAADVARLRALVDGATAHAHVGRGREEAT